MLDLFRDTQGGHDFAWGARLLPYMEQNALAERLEVDKYANGTKGERDRQLTLLRNTRANPDRPLSTVLRRFSMPQRRIDEFLVRRCRSADRRQLQLRRLDRGRRSNCAG